MADEIQKQMKRARDFATAQANRAARKVTGTDIPSSVGALRTTTNRAVVEANRIITEHPATAVAAAVAAGALAAWLFPGTTRKVVKAAPKIARTMKYAADKAQEYLPDATALASRTAEHMREHVPELENRIAPIKKAATHAKASAHSAAQSAAGSAIQATRTASASLRKAAAKTAGDARKALAQSDLPEQAAQLLDKMSEGAAKAASTTRKIARSLKD